MLEKYPKFKRGESETIFKKLPKTEQKIITDYLFWRQSSGLNKTEDLKRMLIQVRKIIGCDFNQFKKLEQHTRLVVLIKNSYWSVSVKKNMKIDLNNFFGEYLFSDWWSAKFRRVYSNKNSEKGDNYKQNLAIPTDEEVEKMVNEENSTYWKTFLLILATTGLRTKECRLLEIVKIKFNSDESATIEIHMTKTGKEKVVFTDKQTTFWIKKLIKETKGKYLFHAKNDINKPISRSITNYWFKNLSFKATGKYFIPYSLRHKKATQLYILAKNNKIAESTALRLMGHSKSQMNNYDHTPKEEDIKILKEQAFNIEVSPEKKHELEIKIELLTKRLDKIESERKIEIAELKRIINK